MDGCFVDVLGAAGAGGLVRDGNGSWQSGFVANLGHSTAECAEIWAIYFGLAGRLVLRRWL